MTDEKPYPWAEGYSHTNATFNRLHREGKRTPAPTPEEILNPTLPQPGSSDGVTALMWGGFPTLIEKLRYRSLERKKLKAMTPQARAAYKDWQKFQRKLGS